MGTELDREGDFQIQIKEYGVTKYDSGATAIAVVATVLAQWNPDTASWDDWTQYDVDVNGYLIVIKKDGTPNAGQVEALCKFAGWNASLAAVAEKTWTPAPCQCSVQMNEYKEQVTYRINFLNAFDRTPGGIGNMKPEDAKALDMQYGASLRALAGSATHGTTKPAGKPATPPRRSPGKPADYPDPNAHDAANAELQAAGADARLDRAAEEAPF